VDNTKNIKVKVVLLQKKKRRELSKYNFMTSKEPVYTINGGQITLKV
jgi:hypothetical protein